MFATSILQTLDLQQFPESGHECLDWYVQSQKRHRTSSLQTRGWHVDRYSVQARVKQTEQLRRPNLGAVAFLIFNRVRWCWCRVDQSSFLAYLLTATVFNFWVQISLARTKGQGPTKLFWSLPDYNPSPAVELFAQG